METKKRAIAALKFLQLSEELNMVPTHGHIQALAKRVEKDTGENFTDLANEIIEIRFSRKQIREKIYSYIRELINQIL